MPGHWEGDLITGKENKSAIGTLVERSTGYVMLLHLPNSHGADDVQKATVEAMGRLPRSYNDQLIACRKAIRQMQARQCSHCASAQS